MKKREDGYILVYVLVVITLLCLLGTTICAIALRNYQAQQASVERMQQTYAAEGLLEQFVAEVQTKAKQFAGSDLETEDDAADDAKEKLQNLFAGTERIKIENLSITPVGWETTSEGDTYVVSVRAVSGDIAVSAEMRVTLDISTYPVGGSEADPETTEQTYSYSITKVTLTYESYTVGASEIAEGGGAS